MSYESEPPHVDGPPMSEPEHTPGPWIFRSGGDLEVKTKRGVEMLQTPAHVVKVDQDGEGRKRTMFICDCAGVGLPNEANARLIAAAPETAAELVRLRQERAQMGLRIFVAEKELKKIALNHAEPARSGVVAAIGALNGDFPNGAKGIELEMDRLRDTNRDQATILADLRGWMSVAGMAVEKDVDMLFVLKGRFDALVASNRELVEALEDTLGALRTVQAACALAQMPPRVFAGLGGKGIKALARAKASG